MKKKLLAMLLTGVMVLSLTLLVSPSKASADDYPTPDNPITIRMANFVPEEDNLGVIFAKAAEKIEELSEGAIKVECYYNGTVLGFSDMYTGISDGTADVGLVGMAVLDANTQLNQIFSALHKGLPMDDKDINECYWEVIEKCPELSEELAQNNLVRIGLESFAGSDTLFCSKKAIQSADDFSGLIIQSSQSLPGKLFTSLGASTVSMEVSDYYNSLDRGVTDCVYDCMASFDAQKLAELGTDYTYIGNGGISAGIMNILMNKNTFDKLSPEQQQIMYDAFAYGVEEGLKESDLAAERALATIEEKNANVYTIEGDALEPIYEEIDKINEEWFTNIEKAGFSTVRDVYAAIEESFAAKM